MSHTKEPWRMRLSDNATPYITHGDGYEIDDLDHLICVMPAEIAQSFNSFENARRIVACVNACANLTTEYLESNTVLPQFNQLVTMALQRDELLAEMRIVAATTTDEESRISLDAAIAKVKP